MLGKVRVFKKIPGDLKEGGMRYEYALHIGSGVCSCIFKDRRLLFGNTCSDVHDFFRISDTSTKTRGHPYKLFYRISLPTHANAFLVTVLLTSGIVPLPTPTFPTFVHLSGPSQVLTFLLIVTVLHRVSIKNKQNYFCYNYVKLPPNPTILAQRWQTV